jgi:NTE family protein
MITNLCCKGGGVRGIADAGVIKVLEDNGVLSNIQRTVGTSAGALQALLVALRYSAAEIYQQISALNFASLESGFNIIRELTQEGLYSNRHLLAWVENVISAKLGPNATFADLKTKGFGDYHCVASMPAVQDIQLFSWDTTPTQSIALATVASMSIPGFFPKITMPGIKYDLVDGGLIENYYITLFDKESAPLETLGLFLHNFGVTPPLPTRTPLDMAIAVFQSSLASQDVDDLNDPLIMQRSIIIDTLGISSTDFSLTAQQKTALYQSGINCANLYIKSKSL